MPVVVPICKTELVRRFPLAQGRVVTVILSDSFSPEDPYINLVRAKALSVRTGELFDANKINRIVKDSLIKTNISI